MSNAPKTEKPKKVPLPLKLVVGAVAGGNKYCVIMHDLSLSILICLR